MTSRSATQRIGNVFTASAGICLLLLIIPHVNPWTMTGVRASMAGEIAIVKFLGVQLQFPRAAWTAALVLLALGSLHAVRHRLRAPSISSTPAWVVLACTGGLVFTMTPAKRGFGVVLELVLGSFGFALLVAGAAPLLGPAMARLEGPRQRLTRAFREMPARLFVALVFGFVFITASLGSWLLFGHTPHVVDSMDQLFHARMFLLGKLWVPSPEPREFFAFTHMIDNGHWYSQYPPGHTALLALGLLVHAPWAVGPLAGALSAALLYYIGKEMYDDLTGRVAALLACLSPFILLMSSSFMNHTTTLLFLELFLLGFVRMVQGTGRGSAVLAGVGLGYAFTIRPLTAAGIGAPFALYAAWKLVTSDASYVRRALFALAAFAVPIAALLAFNQLTNGDPFRFGYEALYGKNALPGFGRSGWWNERHDATHGLAATLENFNALNQYLLALPIPALALPLLGMTWRRPRAWDALSIASVASLAGAYFFYWYQDWAFGPRFLYCASAPLLLLSAAGVLALPDFLARFASPGSQTSLARHAFLALLVAFGYGVAARGHVLASFYSRNFADGNRAIVREIGDAPSERSVVLVPPPFYPSLFPRNEPLLDSRVIYARDLGPEKNERLRSRLPDRRFYKLFAFEKYTLVPYEENPQLMRDLIYTVPPRGPLTIEATAAQASWVNGTARNQGMGEVGSDWKNHDQLRVVSPTPGAEVGFRLWTRDAADRTFSARLTHGPDLGAVVVRLNGHELVTIDLQSPTPHARNELLGRAQLRPGLNALSFRVVAKDERSRVYALGLDYVVVD